MSLKPDLKRGKGYEKAASQSFRVVGVDENNQTIEIQYLDGALDYIDYDAWHTMEVDSIVPPKDWEGLCDDDLDGCPDDEYMDDDPANDESWDEDGKLLDEESEIEKY